MATATPAAPLAPAPAPRKGITLVSGRQRAWRTFKRNKSALYGVGLILAILVFFLVFRAAD